MPDLSAVSPVQLKDLGDLPRLSDTRHGRRARFHQAWFRAEVLGVRDWGATPSGRPIGSILPSSAAAAGANFTSDSSHELFKARRQQGWGLDPVRMTSHLTSSQTLLVNLLGPLLEDTNWLAQVLKTTLDRPDLIEVLDAQVEFAPASRSRYLGDMTRVDAFFRVRFVAGIEAVVLELKYIDRFSRRKVPIATNRSYFDLARTTGLWRAPFDAFSDEATSQLLRCHALGTRTVQVEDGEDTPATLLLVTHPLDSTADSVFARYRHYLQDPNRAVHVTLDQLLIAAEKASLSQFGRESVRRLSERYIDHEGSELLWREHIRISSG